MDILVLTWLRTPAACGVGAAPLPRCRKARSRRAGWGQSLASRRRGTSTCPVPPASSPAAATWSASWGVRVSHNALQNAYKTECTTTTGLSLVCMATEGLGVLLVYVIHWKGIIILKVRIEHRRSNIIWTYNNKIIVKYRLTK